MSTDVRIKVEDYESVLPAMEYEVLLIMLRIARNTTEDALIRL
jgi:hypothetical protein